MDNEYRYAELALTPALFADLLLELAPGRLIRRNEAVELVTAFHESHGGAPAHTNLFSTAKKAFSNMAKVGTALPAAAHGYYRVSGTSVEPDDPDDVTDEESSEVGFAGYQYVYAYFLQTYKDAAALRAEHAWPHKVGMTTTTVPDRLRSQVGTALPEAPTIARIFACEDAALLERAFHAVLELRGRKIAAAPGAEWFLTNGDELDEIAAFVAWTDPTITAEEDPAAEA